VSEVEALLARSVNLTQHPKVVIVVTVLSNDYLSTLNIKPMLSRYKCGRQQVVMSRGHTVTLLTLYREKLVLARKVTAFNDKYHKDIHQKEAYTHKVESFDFKSGKSGAAVVARL
jgi:transketolase N-terminal domain/subunit